jgi:hypothetical protein
LLAATPRQPKIGQFRSASMLFLPGRGNIILETTKPSSAVVATLFNRFIDMSVCRCGIAVETSSHFTIGNRPESFTPARVTGACFPLPTLPRWIGVLL